MNAVTSYVAIVSLLLALATAGGTAKQQADVNSPAAARNITPSRIALNHNETMVNDAASVLQADPWGQWLTSVQAFVFTRFSTYAPGGCEEWGCGSNHNETFVQDAASTQPANDWDLLTKGEQVPPTPPECSSSVSFICRGVAAMSGGAARTTTRRWCAKRLDEIDGRGLKRHSHELAKEIAEAAYPCRARARRCHLSRGGGR